jgi:hypothetical protein
MAMRKWHRWLGIVFAGVILWVALTGVLSYAAEWWPAAAPSPEAMARAAPPAGFQCPEGWRCLPPRPEGGGMRGLVGTLHHLHSGEELGGWAEVLIMLSGLALTFFAVSGMWMYFQMLSGRKARGRGEFFWD